MNPAQERERRDAIWQKLLALTPDRNATTAMLEAAGIRPLRTGQGIFRDFANTSALAPEGVSLSLLDTGTTYTDAFDEDAGEYHYPTTKRGGSRDENEIDATKNAGRLGLPVFVILKGASASTREVRRGWIESWDDYRSVFLVAFREPRKGRPEGEPEAVPDPFVLTKGPRARRGVTVASRPGQARFRYNVLGRCRGQCVVCELRVDVLLEAAHVCSIEAGGTDDARNGIALCRNHHRAFDGQSPLFGLEPETHRVVARNGYTLENLQITREVLCEKYAPDIDALRWAWKRFQGPP